MARVYSRAMASARLAAALALIAVASGCGGSAQQLAQPPAFQPAGQTKCKVRASSDRPLVIEWPSSDRAELEAEAKHGLVVVRYSGCEMELLPQCHVKGTYRYTPTTRKLERVTINNEDDLYAQLPIGAARLEGTLAKAGQLVVSMNVVGRYDAMEPAPDKLDGMCDGATHVVTGLTAGAFEFYAGASASTGGGIGVAGVGAGAKSTSDKQTLDRDGDAASCTVSKSDDTAPPDGCGALLRVEVAPLAELASIAPPATAGGFGMRGVADVMPAAPAPTIPPGDGIVRVHIDSPDPSVELRGFGVSKLRPVGSGFESLGPSTILCHAPCDSYVDARMGQSMVVAGPGIPSSSWFQLYDRTGDVDLSVRPGNQALSTLSMVGYSLGILAVVGGGSTLLTGAAIKSSDSGGSSNTGGDLEKWGGIVLGGGAVLIGAAVVMDLTGSTKVEIKPGVGAAPLQQ